MGSFSRTLPYLVFIISFAIIFISSTPVQAQYDDVRCKCICPVASVVTNNTNTSNRKLYIGNVPPNECNCDFVVLPQLDHDVQDKAKEFCPRCECKYESRNTAVIRFFVIFIIGVVGFLVIYMVFLMILDPWIHKRSLRSNYHQYFNEEVSMEEHGGDNQGGASSSDNFAARRRLPSSPPDEGEENVPRGVLDRVGHTQAKWKRQVSVQRKNIYDDHTMLN